MTHRNLEEQKDVVIFLLSLKPLCFHILCPATDYYNDICLFYVMGEAQ